jgi:hypothetical protein
MSTPALKPILLVGGSGLVGRTTAETLRAFHPTVPIAIGGRDLDKARAVASAIGGEAVRVDLAVPDLGLPDAFVPSAVIPFVKDETLHGLRYAQRHRAAYASISSGSLEIAPEVAQFIQAKDASAVVLLSHWLAGAASVSVLAYARAFARVDSVAIGAVLDEQDIGGPAAYADFERLSAAPRTLGLAEGKFGWVDDVRSTRRFVTTDGVEVEGKQYAPLDVASLGAILHAPSVRLDLVVGESAGRRRGGSYSTEIVLEIEGVDAAGARTKQRHTIAHAGGQAPLTAMSIVLTLERLLGLDGEAPVGPGLYSPDTLLEPAAFVERLRAFGAELT